MRELKYYDIVLAPVITEKGTLISEHNQLVFSVALDANKNDIKKAVEHLFEVKVASVNTVVRQGKSKRFKGIMGRRSDKKHAYVTLQPGYRIDVSVDV